MSAKAFAITPQDTTTLFDALQRCTAEELAQAALGQHASHGTGMVQGRASKLAANQVASMLRVLFSVGPNCEASSRIILPWKPSHLAQLSNMSWPDALGTRIVVPAGASRVARSRLLAKALVCMSYV